MQSGGARLGQCPAHSGTSQARSRCSYSMVGPGTVHRVCLETQRRFFDPPELGGPGVWANIGEPRSVAEGVVERSGALPRERVPAFIKHQSHCRPSNVRTVGDR
jgi:hypothetical protein